MRVVIDTNVVVSGFLNPSGYPGQIVDAILSRKVTVLYDDRVINEYREVFGRPKFRAVAAEGTTFIVFIEEFGEYFSGQKLDVVLPDESDLPFLEVAAAGLADALITGNYRHFKPQRGRHGVRVCTPADFVGRPT